VEVCEVLFWEMRVCSRVETDALHHPRGAELDVATCSDLARSATRLCSIPHLSTYYEARLWL
jgi:hypothetical protein